MRDIKIIFLTSILILLIVLYGFQTYEYLNLVNSYNELQRDYRELLDQNRILKSIVSSISSNATGNISLTKGEKYIEGRIVAVSVNGDEMRGVLVNYTLMVKRGSGNIFISITPHIGVDLQSSLEAAKMAAQKYVNVDLNSYDFYLLIRASDEVGMVDGPSAGLLLALSIVSLFNNMSLNDFCITGAIDPNGVVHEVGGILEKVTACAEAGIHNVILPLGQSKVIVYEKHERTIIPGFTVVTIEPKEVDLKTYLSERGYDMEIYEVGTLGQAISIIKTH